MCRINTAKFSTPLRSDNKIRLLSIVSDLEVEDEKRVPFRLMRYPIEDGKKHSELFAKRSNWFVTECQFDRKTANEWTTVEFNAFYGTQPEMVKKEDPGNTVEKFLN